MKPYALFLILILFLSVKANGQKYFSVIAENGLIVRQQSKMKSDRLGKLACGEDVIVVVKTMESLEIVDNEQVVKGFWWLINSKSGLGGFVFSGYLLEKKGAPWKGVDCKDEVPCHTMVSWDQFDLVVYNYQTQENITIKQDTIQAFEYVFNEVGDKLMHIVPKGAVDSVSVSYTVIENIYEQYNFRTHNDFEQWEKNRVRWNGYEPFIVLKNKFNFFRIPVTKYEGQEILRKQKMQLRDTLVDLSGESDNVATMVYKEKACGYSLGPVVLKIELFEGTRRVGTKYFVVDLSYGC